ncbi:unnamed protein product [Adineta steineri]|uniref:Uncharacterized protein n=1 Tax=Adineta steineri TaxID=433720 RepID=A0A814CRM0_9BILA|nr:unnamed protein product [Adineta steineri]
MRFTNKILLTIIILFSIQSYFCQQDSKLLNHDIINYNNNQTLTLDNIFTENSLNINSSIPKTIIEYSSIINKHTKYITDEEDYTSNESIEFSIYTTQQIITILAGFTSENIDYIFNIENGRPKIIFSRDKLSNLILTTKNESELINNGQWHRLSVERTNQKLRFILDNIEQSNIDLPDEWQTKTNIFIGSELIPAPNNDFNGKIGDIRVINVNRSLTLDKEDYSNTTDENLIDSITIINNQSELIQTIAFLPDNNNEIILSSPNNSSFERLSFSFRTYANASTLIQFEDVKINIDNDGYLTLAVENRQTQRIFSSNEQKPINDGNLYFVQLELNNRTLEVWMDINKKTFIELSSSFFIITNFTFGLHNEFIGCIENITYNQQVLIFQHLPLNRQQCSSNNIILKSIHDIYIDQIISFEEYDRPLVINLDNPEIFYIFAFSFYTQESNSIICSLADKTYDNIITLSVHHEHLVLSYNNKQRKRIEMSMNNSINDRNEHKLVVRLINKDKLVFELDGYRIIEDISNIFYINTIYIGKLDGFIKEQYSDLDGENFIGCIKDIILNGKSLVKLEHIYRSSRLGNICRITNHERKNVISYISSDISFSIRDDHDIIELEMPYNDEFYHCQLSIKTRTLNGVILSMYSNDDDYGLILFLNNGKLHLKYHSITDTISQFIFNDNQTINDGQKHDILISRQLSKLTSYKNMFIDIDQRSTEISFSSSSSLLVFDIIIIGGSHREMSTNVFIGCFSNITYNHHPLLPEGIVKFDRYDCFYDQDSICDRQIPCNNIQPLQFCGQIDCSLVCIPSSTDNTNKKGLLRYFSDIEQGEYEQIYLTIFTTTGNSTLFVTSNGSTQVSIILQDYYPRLIIQNGGIIYTYDFPGRVRNDQWHILQCQKTLNTIDLTFDDETRHYTNVTEHFTLFTDNLIYICGGNFNGYIQDIILTADSHYENLIQNSIHNPGLIDYDASVTWNNRANIPESAPPPRSSQYESRPGGSMPCYLGCWTPCERIQCLNGGYCIQPATQTTLAYCHCPSQYTGYRCEQGVTVDPCLNYQCGHGTCNKDRSNQPYCSCYEGYGGSRCETQIDACARVSCNYGTCINEGTSYRCECHGGYEGPACDRQIDPCASFVCYNGGVCNSQYDSQPSCQCALGYRGVNCYEAEVIDPCSRYDCYGGTCTNERGAARCICPPGRAGTRCQDDICTIYPCANSGQCVPEGGSRRCICMSPYYGDDCREAQRTNPCDNIYCGFGQCHEGYCECHGGYSGPRCDIAPDLCAGVNCNQGTCFEGRCTCLEGYTGTYCETLITTSPPVPSVPQTPLRPLLTPQTVGLVGPKKGQLIDYGRLLGARAGPIGWLLAPLAGLLLIPLALAFAARKCTQGACLPGGGRYIPVTMGTTGATQTDNGGAGNRVTRDLKLIDERELNLAKAANETETTRIEQTREIVREYGGMEAAAGALTTYPTMSSRYGDFARENQQQQQQQTSSGYSQQHIIETDYHPPPVADFGYGRGGATEGYRDTFESWETTGAASGGYSMNTMFADGGLQTDYELSNINSVSMTPNGKYAIVGQSQGPPQIWDAINGQLVSSMQGTSTNCSKVALACSGTLLVGLASDGVDSQPSILQIWDVNTGKPVQLTHQIKCATFALSNNSSNLIMAGNQKYGRGISVGILDLNNSELTKEIKSDTNQSYGGTPSFVTLTPDERYAIVGCTSGSTTNYVVFDLTTQQELVQPSTIIMDCEPKCSLVLNNEQMLTGTRNGQVILWDIPTCQRLHTLNDNGQSAHRDRITDIKLSPDRSCVVTASADGTGKVWDTNSKELISRLIGHKREITCVCVSTNQLVATGSKDQNICLWRMQTGQTASTMPVSMTPLDIHMAAHNRTIVAIGDKDGERQLLMLRVVSIQR